MTPERTFHFNDFSKSRIQLQNFMQKNVLLALNPSMLQAKVVAMEIRLMNYHFDKSQRYANYQPYQAGLN